MNNDAPRTATGSDFVAGLGAAIQEHPIPAALIGMGLVWLMAGRPSETIASVAKAARVDRLSDAAADTFSASRAKFNSGVGVVVDAVSEAGSRVGDQVQNLDRKSTRL